MTEFRGGADDIVLRFSELAINAGLDQQKISNVATEIRREYAGSVVYVKKYDPMLDSKVLDMLSRNGNARQVAKEMNLHRSTVYKIISRGRKK